MLQWVSCVILLLIFATSWAVAQTNHLLEEGSRL